VNRPEFLDHLDRWQVVAAGHRPGRKQPDYVIGEGTTEAHALRGLASLLPPRHNGPRLSLGAW
jgi:hypothetical protein